MHAELKKKEVLHADETMLEVLCEPDRPAKTNSYMWMYRTSGDSVPIILYDYREGRSGNYPKEFLEGFKGYLHVDYADKVIMPIFYDFHAKRIDNTSVAA